MSHKIRIEGEGSGIIVLVQGPENPQPQHPSDASWLSCEIQVKVPPFRGSYAASIAAADFAYFEADLSAVLSGGATAMFRTDEEGIEMRIDIRPTGRAEVSGACRVLGPPQIRLDFRFESDVTMLRTTLDDLGAVTRHYAEIA